MNETTSFSFQKKYKLKCQTPIIHFQPDQEGATLRATEVKPKLDRFLWKCRENKIEDTWLIKKGTKALKYKIKFQNLGKIKRKDIGYKTFYDIYYGNMGNGEKKQGIQCDVEMTIICMIPELLDFIDENIENFFIQTNFGTMQNKGFGSYIVENKNIDERRIAEVLKKGYGVKKCYVFDGGGEKYLFKRIKIIYGIMKSGVNNKGYQRSLLFQYMHEKGIGNEKALLKQRDLVPKLGKSKDQIDKKNYYVRALLGVTDKYEYLNSKEKDRRRDKTMIEISDYDRDEKNRIERLHSPIFFKVINDKVYFVATKIDEEIYGKRFKFTNKNIKNKEKNTTKELRKKKNQCIIQVPKKDEIGEDFLEDFLWYCKEKMNNGALEKFDETKSIEIREL